MRDDVDVRLYIGEDGLYHLELNYREGRGVALMNDYTQEQRDEKIAKATAEMERFRIKRHFKHEPGDGWLEYIDFGDGDFGWDAVEIEGEELVLSGILSSWQTAAWVISRYGG